MKTWRESATLFGISFLLGSVVLGIVLAPTLHLPFAHHDQYRFFFEETVMSAQYKDDPTNDCQYEWLKAIGRPLAAEMEYVIFRNVETVGDLSRVRLLTLLCMGLVLAAWTVSLHRFGLSPAAAFCVSAATLTLPGPQFSVVMASFNHPAASLLGLLAAWIIRLVPVRPLYELDFRSAVAGTVTFTVATLLFVTACCCYPPSAFFFLLPTLAMVVLSGIKRWREVRWAVVRDLALTGTGCVAYFILIRIIARNYQGATTFPEQTKMQVDSKLLDKVKPFLDSASVMALNLWNVPATKGIAYIALGIMGAGLLAGAACVLWRTRSPLVRWIRAWHGVQWLATVIVLLLASEATYLAAPQTAHLYRVHVVYAAMVLVLLVGAAKGLGHWWPRTLQPRFALTMSIALLVLGGLIGSQSSLLNCGNAHLELSYVTTQLAPHLGKPVRRIHIVKPIGDNRSYFGLPAHGDEINRNSLYFPQYLPGIVRAAILNVADKNSFVAHPVPHRLEDIQSAPHWYTVITASEHGEPIVSSEDCVVIDMSLLQTLANGPIHSLMAPELVESDFYGFRVYRLGEKYMAVPATGDFNLRDTVLRKRKLMVESDSLDSLRSKLFRTASLRGVRITASAPSPNPGVSPNELLDESPRAIWHASAPGDKPVWLQFEFAKPTALKEIGFLGQPSHPERSPRDFVLYGAHVDSDWVELLRVEDGPHAVDGQWRAWPLDASKAYHRYKLDITRNCGDPGMLTLYRLRAEIANPQQPVLPVAHEEDGSVQR